MITTPDPAVRAAIEAHAEANRGWDEANRLRDGIKFFADALATGEPHVTLDRGTVTRTLRALLDGEGK